MPITAEQRGTLERLIRDRLKQLAAEIHGNVARARDETHASLSGEAPDSADEATADLLGDLANADTTRDLHEMRELEAALARIEDIGFGTCTQCDRDIAYERLLAYPGATRCVDCQAMYEKLHMQAPPPRL